VVAGRAGTDHDDIEIVALHSLHFFLNVANRKPRMAGLRAITCPAASGADSRAGS
jgi:hypothetical protein